MLICHCRAVTDRAVRATIATGARHPAAVAEGCGAGSRCGGCLPALLELLEQHASIDERIAVEHTAA